MKNFDYLEPTSVAEACALLKQHGSEAKVFAGGAHVTILMKQGLYQPKALVNIKKIPELRGIKFDAAEGLMIGALVTHRELETSALIKEKFPELCEAEREVANIRVRNMGTVGGNLASGEPLTDLSQIFIALDGKLKIIGAIRAAQRSPSKTCSSIFTRPVWPKTKSSHKSCCRLCRRDPASSTSDFPAARSSTSRRRGSRCELTLDKEAVQVARIVLGCVGPTPVRARKAEALDHW